MEVLWNRPQFSDNYHFSQAAGCAAAHGASLPPATPQPSPPRFKVKPVKPRRETERERERASQTETDLYSRSVSPRPDRLALLAFADTRRCTTLV